MHLWLLRAISHLPQIAAYNITWFMPGLRGFFCSISQDVLVYCTLQYFCFGDFHEVMLLYDLVLFIFFCRKLKCIDSILVKLQNPYDNTDVLCTVTCTISHELFMNTLQPFTVQCLKWDDLPRWMMCCYGDCLCDSWAVDGSSGLVHRGLDNTMHKWTHTPPTHTHTDTHTHTRTHTQTHTHTHKHTPSLSLSLSLSLYPSLSAKVATGIMSRSIM